MNKIKLSVAVEESIHKQLKYKAFDDGVTVQQIVESALKQYLNPAEAEETTMEESKAAVKRLIAQLLASGDAVTIETTAATLRALSRMKNIDKLEKKSGRQAA